MVFSSTVFACFFLPAVLLVYFAVPVRAAKNVILLAASLFFYAYGEPKFVFLMLGSILVNYGLALAIDHTRSKALTALAAVLNLGVLFVFKYLDFFLQIINDITHAGIPLPHLHLPIGISFFTFQILSYVIDVYREDAEVQKNPLDLALYISLFPQLIAGPIVRYKTIEKEIRKRRTTVNLFGDGAKRFMMGFARKVLLANNIAKIAESCFAVTEFASVPVPVFWLGAIAYSLQIYFDFSGYSDMAIGLGHMFGFHFEENFNYPYAASSITDFWRRWHISLSSFFRDYVYIPLGGSRVSTWKNIRNLLVVWLCTGIWHGANYTFIVWGLSYFVLLVLEKYVIRPQKKPLPVRAVYRVFTLLCVVLLWVVFNSPSVGYALKYIGGMFGVYHNGFDLSRLGTYMEGQGIFLACAAVLSFPVFRTVDEACRKVRFVNNWIRPVVLPLVMVILFVLSLSYLVIGTHNPFIYFNF